MIPNRRPTDDKRNVFIEGMKKNIGREVTVILFTPTGQEELTGTCEGMDFGQKSIIIRTATDTILVPRYLYLKRARPKPEGD